ncbi:hypothetical protein DRO61_11185 [Candidatus Bathyarchaeota archaeon]|nr:MAG: hypothetical protein DRO61_11185 [Candidatus Bathyarchaeota archaeon]
MNEQAVKEFLGNMPRNELRTFLADMNIDVKRGIGSRTDAYKFGGHWFMLPDNTEYLNSYFCSRPGAKYSFTKWEGLQGILKKYMCGQQVYEDELDELATLSENFLGDKCYFNRKGFEKMLKKHNGRIPVSIQSVKEGSRIPIGHVMMQVINTDPEFPWIVNYIETLLMHCWYASVIATKTALLTDFIGQAVEKSCDADPETRAFLKRVMFHCFGYRSATSEETAGVGGLAILSNTLGTDTMAAIWQGIDYYNADPTGKGIALSVAATEHSIQTAEYGEYGPDEGDRRYLRRMLRDNPFGILSLVGDGNSIEKFVGLMKEPEFVDLIIKRAAQDNGKLNRVVVRPDSPRFENDTPIAQVEWIADELYNTYGGGTNSYDLRTLNSAVGVIYGDGLSEFEIIDLYTGLMKRYDVTSFIVGQGGGAMQKANRDDQRSKIACSAQYRNGKWWDVYKDPLDKSKASLPGRLALIINDDGEYETIREEALGDRENLLIEVFRDGEMLVEWSLDDLRADWK